MTFKNVQAKYFLLAIISFTLFAAGLILPLGSKSTVFVSDNITLYPTYGALTITLGPTATFTTNMIIPRKNNQITIEAHTITINDTQTTIGDVIVVPSSATNITIDHRTFTKAIRVKPYSPWASILFSLYYLILAIITIETMPSYKDVSDNKTTFFVLVILFIIPLAILAQAYISPDHTPVYYPQIYSNTHIVLNDSTETTYYNYTVYVPGAYEPIIYPVHGYNIVDLKVNNNTTTIILQKG